MRQKKFWFAMSGILVVLTMALVFPTRAVSAGTYKVLHRFTGKDGAGPQAGLIFDAAGNLYGTTTGGGDLTCGLSIDGCGVVFRLTLQPDGSWTESVLYSFCSLTNCADGAEPAGALTLDAAGELYGTTMSGGSGLGGSGGVAFKLAPQPDGSWVESVLYNFCSLDACIDGGFPNSGLTRDAAGNLYGTAPGGGGGPVAFKLAPQSDGSWVESVLYYFCPNVNCFPSGLTLDATGHLYGTTSGGGLNGRGLAFKLATQSYGISVLYNFCSLTNCADGADPVAGVTLDAAGNLYGTTVSGGNANCIRGCGVVFKLTPQPDGSWVESVLHTFSDHPAAFPYAAVIFDSAGNLYGTTSAGGPQNDGAVFKLGPGSGGGWTYDVLHVFHGAPAAYPYASLVLDKARSLYGTASTCGSGYKCKGVVFEMIP